MNLPREEAPRDRSSQGHVASARGATGDAAANTAEDTIQRSDNKEFMTKAEYNRWLVKQENAKMAEETREQAKSGEPLSSPESISELIDLQTHKKIQWRQLTSERETNMLGKPDDSGAVAVEDLPKVTLDLEELPSGGGTSVRMTYDFFQIINKTTGHELKGDDMAKLLGQAFGPIVLFMAGAATVGAFSNLAELPSAVEVSRSETLGERMVVSRGLGAASRVRVRASLTHL